MKVLKWILMVLGGLIALVLIIALFAKKDYALERSLTINKPHQEIFDFVKMFKNQKDWNSFAQADPKIKVTFRGTDGTVGSVFAWESKMMGNGEQELKKLTDGERLDIELRFKGMMASSSPVYMTTRALNDSTTQVTYGMSGKMNYPMNFMGLFLDMDKDMIGPQYQKSLENLKAFLEK